MSSRLQSFVRKLDLTSMIVPGAVQEAQKAVRVIGVPELAAAARWGIAGSLVIYWMIEHHFQEPKES